MRHLKTFLTVIGAVTILVLAANTAVYAATGGKFILGKTNKASKISTLKRTTAGPALSLKTTSGSAAPMTVIGSGKVANLNADKLDGYDSSALKTTTYTYGLPAEAAVSTFTVHFPGLPVGVYLASFSVIASGTVNCVLEYTTVPKLGLISYSSLWSGFSTANATGVIDSRVRPIQLRCFADVGTITTDPDNSTKSRISFTRIGTLSSGSAAARLTAPRALAPSTSSR